MKRLSRLIIIFLKNFTWAVLVVALLLAYFYLPTKFPVHFTEFDVPDQQLDKSTFFYGVSLLAVVFNVLLSLLATMITSLPEKFLTTPNRAFWLENATSRKNFYEIYKDWFIALSILINVFLIVCVITALRSHQMQQFTPDSFAWLPALGGILLLAWLLFLPIRLRIKKYEILT
jgi:uncharacterized membrane protein